MTGANDGRVAPYHSGAKWCGAVDEGQQGRANPILLRTSHQFRTWNWHGLLSEGEKLNSSPNGIFIFFSRNWKCGRIDS